ncbi:MAG: response regulator transcription factor [Actinomycetota bacterium]
MRAGQQEVSVLVADGEAIFGDALAGALKHLPGFKVVGSQPVSGLVAVEEVSVHTPDVALLDYWLRDMEGPASTVAIAARSPSTRVLLLSWFYGPREIAFAMAAGAAGFLPKSLSLDEVASAVRAAAAGRTHLIPGPLKELAANPKPADREAAEVWQRIRILTKREIEVLALLGREISIQDISRQLGISVATARRHVHHILRKTRTSSQFEAVAFARHYGILFR